jgi:hypothetical protein
LFAVKSVWNGICDNKPEIRFPFYLNNEPTVTNINDIKRNIMEPQLCIVTITMIAVAIVTLISSLVLG